MSGNQRAVAILAIWVGLTAFWALAIVTWGWFLGSLVELGVNGIALLVAYRARDDGRRKAVPSNGRDADV